MNPHLARAIDDRPNDGYLRYHAPRYERLLRELERIANPRMRVLDIGRSAFTDIAHQVTGARIDTLGFEPDKPIASGCNYRFDLNDAQSPDRWRDDLPTYDVIVFCEVLEHLHTSPRPVLAFLRSILADSGIILVQTPNAVVFHKRLIMLAGHNPYAHISEDRSNPAHFREYTMAELAAYCQAADLRVLNKSFENYFDYRYTSHAGGSFSCRPFLRWINRMYALAPRAWRPGLFLRLAPAKKVQPGPQ